MTSAEELIGGAKALLLDFDGPVTTLMPPPRNGEAADQVRATLADVELPPYVATTTDHLAILRFATEHLPAMVPVVERSCTEVEVKCAQESDPSPEIRGLLAGAQQRAVPVAIVSNNSEAAVRVFLGRTAWGRNIALTSCRTPDLVCLLKPNPYLVSTAVRLLDMIPADCILVGDSVSDVMAGRAAGVRVVGLAKNTQRAQQLADAGAAAILLRRSSAG